MTSRLDVVIPGAQKAGTSTLLSVLGRHPGIQRHAVAELGALLEGGEALERAIAAQYPRHKSGLRVAKSAGLMHEPDALRRVVQRHPNVRMLVMLREPVSRAASAFSFAKRTGDESLPRLDEALAQSSERRDVPAARRRWVQYLERSEYVQPMRLMRDLVGDSRMHVVLLEEYRDRPEVVLAGIQDWLGLPHAPLFEYGSDRVNRAATARSQKVARILRHSGPVTYAARRVLPKGVSRGIRRGLLSLNEKEWQSAPAASPELLADLRRRFNENNSILSDEFGLDLSAWTMPHDQER